MAPPDRVARGVDERAPEEIVPWTTLYASTSAVTGPKAISYVSIAVSVGANTVKGPGPASDAPTPVDARRAEKRPKLS